MRNVIERKLPHVCDKYLIVSLRFQQNPDREEEYIEFVNRHKEYL